MTPAKTNSLPQGRARGLYDEQLQRQRQERMLRGGERTASIDRRAEERVENPA